MHIIVGRTSSVGGRFVRTPKFTQDAGSPLVLNMGRKGGREGGTGWLDTSPPHPTHMG